MENNMKTVYSCLLVVLIAITLACGYGSKNYNTAPAAGSIPAISELSPDNTSAGGTAFSITVNGSNFVSSAKVNWNGVAQKTTFVTGNQLMVTIPASMISSPGTAQISVTNPATTGSGPYGMGGVLAETSKAVKFTIN
jgi:IPT/TIG domain